MLSGCATLPATVAGLPPVPASSKATQTRGAAEFRESVRGFRSSVAMCATAASSGIRSRWTQGKAPQPLRCIMGETIKRWLGLAQKKADTAFRTAEDVIKDYGRETDE